MAAEDLPRFLWQHADLSSIGGWANDKGYGSTPMTAVKQALCGISAGHVFRGVLRLQASKLVS